MDSTANDVKHSAFEAKGYPTLMLARKGDKLKPMSYSSGERTVEDLLEWLKETIPEDVCTFVGVHTMHTTHNNTPSQEEL